jgi:hypothetical protein
LTRGCKYRKYSIGTKLLIFIEDKIMQISDIKTEDLLFLTQSANTEIIAMQACEELISVRIDVTPIIINGFRYGNVTYFAWDVLKADPNLSFETICCCLIFTSNIQIKIEAWNMIKVMKNLKDEDLLVFWDKVFFCNGASSLYQDIDTFMLQKIKSIPLRFLFDGLRRSYIESFNDENKAIALKLIENHPDLSASSLVNCFVYFTDNGNSWRVKLMIWKMLKVRKDLNIELLNKCFGYTCSIDEYDVKNEIWNLMKLEPSLPKEILEEIKYSGFEIAKNEALKILDSISSNQEELVSNLEINVAAVQKTTPSTSDTTDTINPTNTHEFRLKIHDLRDLLNSDYKCCDWNYIVNHPEVRIDAILFLAEDTYSCWYNEAKELLETEYYRFVFSLCDKFISSNTHIWADY